MPKIINSHQVSLMEFSLSFHYLFTIFSLSFHYLFTIFSLSFHYLFTIFSLSFHYLFTIFSLSFHYLFTNFSVSLILSISLSLFLRLDLATKSPIPFNEIVSFVSSYNAQFTPSSPNQSPKNSHTNTNNLYYEPGHLHVFKYCPNSKDSRYTTDLETIVKTILSMSLFSILPHIKT
jgi:hypothetical protein